MFLCTQEYRHQGAALKPGMVYVLPVAMAVALSDMGLGLLKDGPADADLSHLTWALNNRHDVLMPEPLTHIQD
jgi:type III secretory pathway component EscT